MEDDTTEQDAQHGQQHTGISEAIERLALILSENGLPRMMARVFAYALVDDSGRHTAAEFASGLQVSQAAISGAVRQLVQAGFLDRVREPGSRRDQYRLYDEDVWSAITLQSIPVFERWENAVSHTIDQVPHGPGHRRLQETLAYLAFMRAEIPQLIDRWKDHRAQIHFDQEPTPEHDQLAPPGADS